MSRSAALPLRRHTPLDSSFPRARGPEFPPFTERRQAAAQGRASDGPSLTRARNQGDHPPSTTTTTAAHPPSPPWRALIVSLFDTRIAPRSTRVEKIQKLERVKAAYDSSEANESAGERKKKRKVRAAHHANGRVPPRVACGVWCVVARRTPACGACASLDSPAAILAAFAPANPRTPPSLPQRASSNADKDPQGSDLQSPLKRAMLCLLENHICPISQSLMVQPMIAEDGHLYEKVS